MNDPESSAAPGDRGGADSGRLKHFISGSCMGERCGMCYREGVWTPATHKVGEEIPHDAPQPHGHNLTQYVCCRHFGLIVGGYSARKFRGCQPSASNTARTASPQSPTETPDPAKGPQV